MSWTEKTTSGSILARCLLLSMAHRRVLPRHDHHNRSPATVATTGGPTTVRPMTKPPWLRLQKPQPEQLEQLGYGYGLKTNSKNDGFVRIYRRVSQRHCPTKLPAALSTASQMELEENVWGGGGTKSSHCPKYRSRFGDSCLFHIDLFDNAIDNKTRQHNSFTSLPVWPFRASLSCFLRAAVSLSCFLRAAFRSRSLSANATVRPCRIPDACSSISAFSTSSHIVCQTHPYEKNSPHSHSS